MLSIGGGIMKGKMLWKKDIVAKTNIVYGVFIDEKLYGEIVYKIYSAEFISEVTLKRLSNFVEFLLGLDVIKDNLYIHMENAIPVITVKSTIDNKEHDLELNSMYLEYIKYFMKEKCEELNQIFECLRKEYKYYMKEKQK
jgi:ribulose 1,5-bisphosphate synthetase/thiazole synthase